MQLMGPKKKWWFIVSAIFIIPGVVSLFVWGLRLGIDFKGGTLMELAFSGKDKVETQEIKNALSDLDLKDLSIQKTANNQVLIRTLSLDEDTQQKIRSDLNQKIGENQEIRLETVGPTVSKSIAQKAVIAVVLASLAIILYIAFAFRKVPRPANSWRFGICAVLALLHDILIVVGIYSILGHYFDFEVDSLFITAILTIMGFSVHDTIVVFDRIRENLLRNPSKNFETIVNDSVVQTLGRSLNTSLTVILVLLAMVLLGGISIRQFVITLLIGITTGTYSSIFNASPLLVVWQSWIMHKKQDGTIKISS